VYLLYEGESEEEEEEEEEGEFKDIKRIVLLSSRSFSFVYV